MKKVRMAMMLGALILGSATVASAQDRPQGGGRRNQMAMLMKDITLTTDQQTKLDVITKKYQEEMQALMAEAQNGDRQGAMAKRRELMTKQSDEVKALLTDEQKKTFDRNMEEMRSRMQNRGGAPTPPPMV